MRIAGGNHFTWLLKAEYEGKDLLPTIAESMKQSSEAKTVGDDIGTKGFIQ